MPSGYKAEINKKEFVKLYTELKSIKAISKRLRYNAKTIRKFISKNNIKILRKTIYNCNEDYFANDTPEVFYWAGFIAADGCVMRKKRDYTFVFKVTLAKQDKKHLEKLKLALGATNPIKDYCIIYKGAKTYASELTIYSRKMCQDLFRFGIIPKKSLVLKFPTWLIDHPFVHHFIRGYIDGDGCFSKRIQKGRSIAQYSFSIRGTPEFLTCLYKIVDKKCFNIERDKKITMTKNIGGIGYSGNNVVKEIAKFLYENATEYLDRKYNKIEHFL